jgi:hypothetical protein
MTTVALAIAAVIGATIALVVDRRMQAQRDSARNDADQTETAQEHEQPGRLTKYMKNIGDKLTGSKQETAKKFQTWADGNIEDSDLKAWLTGLSPEAASALSAQLADFCVNLGFELDWLLEGNMDQDTEIKREALAVVTAYCRACWNAAQSYTDFELFRLLQEIEQEPFARKRRDLGRRLFGELVKREMAASIPPELLLASEKERQEHMARAIQQATEADRGKFKIVLKDVLEAEKTGADIEDSSQSAASTTVKDETEKPKKRQIFGSKGKGQSASAASETKEEPATGAAAPEPSAS